MIPFSLRPEYLVAFATGRVHGKTAGRHTRREFVAFLQEVVSLCPPRQQIHIILDNLSAHKT